MTKEPPECAPLHPASWNKDLENIIRDTQGAPINVHQLMANNPDLLRAWWDFRNHSVSGGTLGNRAGELVILRVAVHMGAWYEWASHVDRGLKSGLAIEEIERVLHHTLPTQLPPADAILLGAVDDLINHHCLLTSTQAELAHYFSVQQIMDIMAIQGMYVILACMIKTWGLPLDADVQARVSQHTSEKLFLQSAARFKCENREKLVATQPAP
jgi:alkylhydroperoxidase family enzyme